MQDNTLIGSKWKPPWLASLLSHIDVDYDGPLSGDASWGRSLSLPVSVHLIRRVDLGGLLGSAIADHITCQPHSPHSCIVSSPTSNPSGIASSPEAVAPDALHDDLTPAPTSTDPPYPPPRTPSPHSSWSKLQHWTNASLTTISSTHLPCTKRLLIKANPLYIDSYISACYMKHPTLWKQLEYNLTLALLVGSPVPFARYNLSMSDNISADWVYLTSSSKECFQVS